VNTDGRTVVGYATATVDNLAIPNCPSTPP
jgi:hypothetical protein